MPKAYISPALVGLALVNPEPPGCRISGLHHRDTLDSMDPSISSNAMLGCRIMVAEANPAIRAAPRSSMRTFFWT